MDSEQQPVKPKRVMSEKQKAGLSLGLVALKAKREAMKLAKETASKQQPAPQAPAAVPAPAPAPASAQPAYVSALDFMNFKNEIMSSLKPASVPPQTAMPAVPEVKVLTGSELLDKIFFSK